MEKRGGGAAQHHRLCWVLSNHVSFRASPAQHHSEKGRGREGGKGVPPGDHRSFLGLRCKGAVGATWMVLPMVPAHREPGFVSHPHQCTPSSAGGDGIC